MIHRLINLPKSNSFYLFGARGTGKSTLLKQHFSEKEAILIDLLEPDTVAQIQAHPQSLLDRLKPYENQKPWVIIDEIQKVPPLLDLVHQQIEKRSFHFALTGSSARKLKRGNANLLAGRAFLFSLFPFSHEELGKNFKLNETLQYGALPAVINYHESIDKRRFLKSYVEVYLKEEILIEQIIRKLPPFRRFLEVSAVGSGEIINYSNLAKDILSDAKTVSSYYTILEDTLLGFFLPAFHTSVRKQQRQAKKFYYFDTGVARTLAGRIDVGIQEKTYEYGMLFENFVVNEIYRLLTYQEKQFQLSYLRTKDDVEVDLIIERAGEPTWLCEIKSTDRVDERYTNSLRNIGKSLPKAKKMILSNDPTPKMFGSVEALPWQEGIKKIVQ